MANERMRWLRLRPTARIIPSSRLRSSASITNRLTSNRIPAITLNPPMAVNSWPIESPEASASSSRSSLTGATSTPVRSDTRAVNSSTTAVEPSAPSNTPPSFDTRIWVCGGRASVAPGPRARDSMVPGGTSTEPPASPISGTTWRTVSVLVPPKAKTSMVSPAPISNFSARRSLMTASSPVGVAPASASPVLAGSAPNARASSKSYSVMPYCGSARRSGPVLATDAPVAIDTRVPSVPGIGVDRTASLSEPSSSKPGTPTISSVGPSSRRAMSRIDESSVSPTMNEAVMMAVPSSEPATTSTASPLRREMLRRASRRKLPLVRKSITTGSSRTPVSTMRTFMVSPPRRRPAPSQARSRADRERGHWR